MEGTQLLQLPEGMLIDHIQATDTGLLIAVTATVLTSRCPLCKEVSSFIHSSYCRRLRDVPCGGRQVQLCLMVRKFFCRNALCERKVFTERLPSFAEPWARITLRLCKALQAIGLATSGKAGSRLAKRLSIHTSRQTVLRRVMDLPPVPTPSVLYLGIDDFSFRRGLRFGTILVDLEHHRVIDVLPDRQAETSAQWMRLRPEITVVSRDRGGEYASAATQGAPQALQCADRFHLLKNVGEALEGCLSRHLAAKRKAQTQETIEKHDPIEEAPRSTRCSSKVEQLQQAYREERLACYEQVVALRKLGMSQAAIAEQVGIGHSTVSRWLAAQSLPPTTRGPYVSRLDPYLPSLFQRWESGCHNMAALFRELVDRGYKGSYESVRDHLVRRLPEGKKNASKGARLSPAPLPSRQATFLFLAPPKTLGTKEQEMVHQLRQSHPEVDLAYTLVQQFVQMLHTRTGEQLDTWLSLVRASQIREFQSLVLGIERDKEAVKAGLTWWVNNGQVEGQVTKLKLIKRQMYGKAGFALLRQRILHAL